MSSLGFNSAYIEDLYRQYESDPQSVSPLWRSFFKKSVAEGVAVDVDTISQKGNEGNDRTIAESPISTTPQEEAKSRSDSSSIKHTSRFPKPAAIPESNKKPSVSPSSTPAKIEPITRPVSNTPAAAKPATEKPATAKAPIAPSVPAKKQKPRSVASPEVRKDEDPLAFEEVVLKGVSARIADNMDASLRVPTATSVRHIPVKLMTENRQLMNRFNLGRGRSKISFTHIIAYALVKALEKYPSLNTSFKREEGKPVHVKPKHVNFGLAIDVEKRNGSRSLMVPNIKGSEAFKFGEFVASYNGLVKKARNGKLEISDFEGTTATLTNPGMIGTVMSVPRLMEGRGLILAVGAIAYPAEYSALPPAELSRLGISQVMTITSTYDHRVIQGAESGAFLKYVAGLITGTDGFYQEIFNHLGIPTPPLTTSLDTSPLIGRAGASDNNALIRKQASVIQLIRAYRVRGHMVADINPLGYDRADHPELDPATYGLTVWDLDRDWMTGGLGGKESLPLRDILQILWDTYSQKVGVEFMHISSPEERSWIQGRIEAVPSSTEVPKEVKMKILEKVNSAEAFERFLHTKFIGHKRFSLEGAETLIPILDQVLSDSADQAVDEVVIGMAHRGRLNVLANTLGKPYEQIFSEFEGNIDKNTTQGSGDVKYHLGTSGLHYSPEGNSVAVVLAANPSHLEAVNPVVEGMVRAKQRLQWDDNQHELVNYDKVLPILIHGDAAFAGQGVVAETLNLSELPGYTTGGTIHIVVNNQIGFTTSPQDARSSIYATDVARMIQAPIFHVNGDDPEACVRIARMALDYRQVFNKDVVIDMLCYRVHGHNEGDEPTYTQPALYYKIKSHKSVREIYTADLLKNAELEEDEANTISKSFRLVLDSSFTKMKAVEEGGDFETDLNPVKKALDESLLDPDKVYTKFDRSKLDHIAKAVTSHPANFNVHAKLPRQFDRRFKLYNDAGKVDWGLGEALAYGSLCMEGNSVRLSGEDSGRGTFSHRHSVLFDQTTEEKYVPLNHLTDGQGGYRVYNSLLSEYAVLGFEYGYSVADPSVLVLWEAQFGDFTNGAQIVIDQFISSAESKWGQTSSLVMLLPHGYEGQGPEHSSARMERYLQMCAEYNMRIANFTTPANFFHALRRQIRDAVKKPLMVMTPKSLLRHPLCVSPISDFTESEYQPIIASGQSNPKKVLMCSGKVYYDLLAGIKERQMDEDIAIIRAEQLYPLRTDMIQTALEAYGSDHIAWVQEESANMGAWSFIKPRLEKKGIKVSYVGRRASASPATGSSKRHAKQQAALVEDALTI